MSNGRSEDWSKGADLSAIETASWPLAEVDKPGVGFEEEGNEKDTRPLALDFLSIAISPNVRKLFDILPGLEPEIDLALKDSASDFISGSEPLQDEVINPVFEEVLKIVTRETAGNNYHNVDHMFHDLPELAQVFLAFLKERDFEFSKYEQQCLFLALVLHDAKHGGRMGKDFPDFKTNIKPTLEFANDFLKDKVPLEMRVRVLCIILATTSFDDRFKPENLLECFAVMIDLGNFWPSFESFMENNLKVSKESEGFETFDSWYAFTKGFLTGYCREMGDSFYQFAKTPAFLQLVDEYQRRRAFRISEIDAYAEKYHNGDDIPYRDEIGDLIVPRQ